MKKLFGKRTLWLIGLTAIFLFFGASPILATIPGINGPTFNLTAKSGYIVTDDGNSIFMWGFADGANRMQYPGPTLIVNEDQLITVNLTNQLSVPVSILFPGQPGVSATMVTGTGNLGLLTLEANPGETVRYTFTASEPGTYFYHSGTRPNIQVEMGLFGALIVRPTLGAGFGYNHADSAFDREYLFVLSEIDPRFHEMVLLGKMDQIDTTTAFPVYWFINGRGGFDTILPHSYPSLPNQPYSSLARVHPQERALVRMIGGGRDLHPFHLHGNHHRVIARDGRLLKGPTGQDLSERFFTTTVGPGQTFDAIFTWTGEGLGWDIYGHADIDNPPLGNFPGLEDVDHNGDGILNCIDPTPEEAAVEYMPDHCKPIPVILPNQQDLTFGPLWPGTPFIGTAGPLPPGEGGFFNPNAGLVFMWHSHNEKELTSNNIFPGGMLTFVIVEHPSVIIP
jgi:FtsP/CotA-like multicopper oxidase with cupredoxin domain